jgi:hypothetical protein
MDESKDAPMVCGTRSMNSGQYLWPETLAPRRTPSPAVNRAGLQPGESCDKVDFFLFHRHVLCMSFGRACATLKHELRTTQRMLSLKNEKRRVKVLLGTGFTSTPTTCLVLSLALSLMVELMWRATFDGVSKRTWAISSRMVLSRS